MAYWYSELLYALREYWVGNKVELGTKAAKESGAGEEERFNCMGCMVAEFCVGAHYTICSRSVRQAWDGRCYMVLICTQFVGLCVNSPSLHMCSNIACQLRDTTIHYQIMVEGCCSLRVDK